MSLDSRATGTDFREGFGESRGICFELLDPDYSNITTRHIRGVAIDDFDRDGDQDIFLATYATLSTRREPDTQARTDGFYRNEGDLIFSPIAELAFESAPRTRAQAAAWGDLDGDGLDDLYVTTALNRPNLLYRNRGDGSFEEIGKRSGVAIKEYGRGAAFADVNQDGYLDIYVCNYVAEGIGTDPDLVLEASEAHPPSLGFRGCANHLFINQGTGEYIDMAGAMGVEGLPSGEGWGAAFCDLNDDGYLDLFVTNDAKQDRLYMNRHGVFQDCTGLFVGESGHGPRPTGAMGVAFGDYDNDADIDLYATNYNADFLFENTGRGALLPRSRQSGVASHTDVIGMGVAFADFDNDGDLDLAVANGHVVGPNPELNILMENLGDGCYVDISDVAGPGFAVLQRSQGLAVADLDGDGRLDIVIGNDDGSYASVLVNRCERAGGWVRLRLVGRPPNTSAIGARVWLISGDETQVRERRAGSSLYSCNENMIHFGVGDYGGPNTVRVRWPDGSMSEMRGVRSRSTVTIVHE